MINKHKRIRFKSQRTARQERAISIWGQRLFYAAMFIVLVLAAIIYLPLGIIPKDLTLVREVFIERGNTPEAKAIVRAHDGGYIIAGSFRGNEAWATKIDADGNVKWRYTASDPNKMPFNSSTTYRAVAVMPDDSVFLCGLIDRSRNEHIGQGLISVLDKDGRLIGEQLLMPQGDTKFSSADFRECAPYKDGALVVGTTMHSIKNALVDQNHPYPTRGEKRYWIIFFDSQGKKIWEKFAPMPEGIGTNSALQIAKDQSILFSMETFGTDVLRLSPQGDVLAHREFPNRLRLVRSAEPDDTIQLVSEYLGSPSLELLTLDSNLQETNRITRSHGDGHVFEAYRLPDQSLVLFGSKDIDNSAAFAQVMKFSPSLWHERKLQLSHKVSSSLWITAATPLYETPGQFVSVRLVVDPNNLRLDMSEEEAQKHRLGLALDFVDTK